MSDMFASFKAAQQSTDGLAAMQETLEKEAKGQDYSDNRFYYPERDKAGNGQAIIRFLPPSEGEKLPYQKFFSHGFKVDTKWFIEECATSKGENCPVCESNDTLWKSGEAGIKIVRGSEGVAGRKRKMRYVANILVMKDPANPENEGKTFLFQFGYKIEEKIRNAFKGDELEGLAAINPFNLWTGAPFLFKIAKVAGQTNYDLSKFMNSGPIVFNKKAMPDADLEKMYKGQVKLTPDYADKLDYKTYEKQKDRLDTLLGNKPSNTQTAESMASADSQSMAQDATPSFANTADSAPAPSEAAQAKDESEFFDEL